ncbi:unnamed protein product [Auanema sp. JU1783]|nr:unnamed protein product [Auanema sp. JU1783]
MSVLTLYESFISAFLYYCVIFLTSELSRRAVDRAFAKSSTIHVFFIELIGTVTICTCVFENGVIIVNYGIGAFFIVSTVLGFLFGTLGRGAYGNPMAPLEQYFYGEMKGSRLTLLVLAQIVGGIMSWRITTELWRYSLPYAPSHEMFYNNSLQACHLTYHQPHLYMIAFEICGTFVMRTVFPRIAAWAIPAFISAIFSFAISYMGDAGLDPIVSSTLFFGCHGVSQQIFMFQYWICPIIGWLSAAYIDRSFAKKPTKKAKKQKQN